MEVPPEETPEQRKIRLQPVIKRMVADEKNGGLNLNLPGFYWGFYRDKAVEDKVQRPLEWTKTKKKLDPYNNRESIKIAQYVFKYNDLLLSSQQYRTLMDCAMAYQRSKGPVRQKKSCELCGKQQVNSDHDVTCEKLNNHYAYLHDQIQDFTRLALMRKGYQPKVSTVASRLNVETQAQTKTDLTVEIKGKEYQLDFTTAKDEAELEKKFRQKMHKHAKNIHGISYTDKIVPIVISRDDLCIHRESLNWLKLKIPEGYQRLLAQYAYAVTKQTDYRARVYRQKVQQKLESKLDSQITAE